MKLPRSQVSRCFSVFAIMKACAVLFILSGVTACGLGMSAEDRIERAEQAIRDGDFNAASLDLKRALQDIPDNANARQLLGRAFLGLGDAASAESELNRALSLGVVASEINADLANSYWLQQKFDQLLAEPLLVDALSDPDRALIRRLRGNSNLATGYFKEAQREFEISLSLEPENISGRLGLISSYAQLSEMKEARRRLDELVGVYPKNASIRNASAALHMAADTPNIEAAIGEYVKAIEFARSAGERRNELEALEGHAVALLQSGQFDGARVVIDEYRELAPDAIYGRILDAQLLVAINDVDGAVSQLQTVLRSQPDNAAGNFLMGVSQARLGKLGQAEAYLATAVQANPSNAKARTMLARLRGDMNKSVGAISALEPLLELNDLNALQVAAEIQMSSGDMAGGLDFLKRRLEAEPENVGVRLDYAAGLMSANMTDAAREVLSQLDGATEGNDATRAAMISVLSLVADGDQAGAIAAAEKAVVDAPEDAVLHNLLGRLYAANDDLSGARQSFRESIRLAPSAYAGYSSLAAVEFAAGNFEAARKVFSSAEGAVENSGFAHYGRAFLEEQIGNLGAAETALKSAIAADPELLPARLMLGRLQAQRGEYSLAREQFEALTQLAPLQTDGHYFLGVLERASGNDDKAIASLQRAIELDPTNPGAVLNLARAHAALDQQDLSMAALQTAYDAGQRHPAVVASLGASEVGNDNLDKALALADTIELEEGEEAVRQLVKGDLYMQDGQFQPASRRFREAYTLSGDWRVAAKQMIAANRAGERDAANLMRGYVSSNPENQPAQQAFAQLLQQQGDIDGAIRQYETVLKVKPESVDALNNLAWIFAERQDPRGVALARDALRLSPDNAAVIDTLGWSLVQTGEAEDGLTLLRRASALAPEDRDISYHVAAALVKIGDNAQAKTLLESLLSEESRFGSRNDAQALLKGLK